MKKTIVLLLCILFTCSFAACSKPNVEYTVYSYSASAIADATIGANEVTFKSIEEKNFMITLGNTTTRPDNTPEQQTFEIIGETYTLPYDYTTQTPMAECETLKDYSLITTYQNVTDDYSVKCETSVSTGEILFFSKSGDDVRNVSGKLTEQEAIEIANSAISSLYGNEAQQAYVYQTIIPVTDNGRNFYAVFSNCFRCVILMWNADFSHFWDLHGLPDTRALPLDFTSRLPSLSPKKYLFLKGETP